MIIPTTTVYSLATMFILTFIEASSEPVAISIPEHIMAKVQKQVVKQYF